MKKLTFFFLNSFKNSIYQMSSKFILWYPYLWSLALLIMTSILFLMISPTKVCETKAAFKSKFENDLFDRNNDGKIHLCVRHYNQTIFLIWSSLGLILIFGNNIYFSYTFYSNLKEINIEFCWK